MFATMKEFSRIIFIVKESRMIVFLLIILLSTNGVHSFLAGQGQFNYVISIQKMNIHFCTGTIIDETHVLTVAHMFLGAYRDQLSVVAGVARVDLKSVHRIKVKKLYLHPLLKKIDISGSVSEDWENDIAIIELKERFQWSTDYGPAPCTVVQFDSSNCPICMMVTWDYGFSKLNQIWTIVFRSPHRNSVLNGVYVGKNQQYINDESNDLLFTAENLGSPIVCDDTMVGFVVKKQADIYNLQKLASTFLDTVPYSEFIHDVLIKGLVDVRPQEFPYIVSIWYESRIGHVYVCGGSILDETHILTTANCVLGKYDFRLKVVAGFIKGSLGHAIMSQQSVRDIKTNNNIAILVLTTPISSLLTSGRLDYLNTKDVSPGLFCDLPLWKDDPDSSVIKVKKLTKARVRISTKRICKKVLEAQGIPVTAEKFCAKNRHSIKVPDFEDSGNPLICEDKLVGILLKAPPQHGRVAEAVFQEIHPYKEFIRSTINPEDTTVTTPNDLDSLDSN